LLTGGSGADSIFGEAGEDELHGGEGNDTIVGGADSDQFFGDAGDDLLNSIDGLDDTLHGGDGTDTNDTYGDTADSVENRPLPSQPICSPCISDFLLPGTITTGGVVGSGGNDVAQFGGPIMEPSGAGGSLTFDDSTSLRIDGLNLIGNTSWNTNTSGELASGWNDIELRFGEGSPITLS